MNYEENYKNNLEALKLKSATLYEKLSQITGNNIFEVFTLKNGIDILDTRTGELLYNKEPAKNLHDKMVKFDDTYGVMPFTYHFGIGNGAFHYALLNERKNTSRVAIIEPEIEILYIALHLNKFADYIKHGTLMLYLEEDFTYASAAELFLKVKGPLYYGKLFTLAILLPYYEKDNYNIVTINRYFKEAIVHSLYNCGNNPLDTYLGVKQHIANLKNVITSPSLKEFSLKSKNTELAVLVATGPSLKKQLPLLKKMQDYITIFAVDSSFNVLYDHGIKADIFVSIERGKATAQLYHDTSKEYFKDTIFAFTSVVHPNLLNHIHKDGVITFSTRDYSHIKYFGLKDYGPVGGGSVANMAYNLIDHAGFKQCVLIGQDLAFSDDGKTHTAGHVHGEIASYVVGVGNIIEVEKYGGNGLVKTNTGWNLFKNFYESDIEEFNARGIKTFNATEGGARIHGSIELPFKDVIERYVDTSRKKDIIKLSSPSLKEIERLSKQNEDKLRELVLSLRKILSKVRKTHKTIERVTDRINKEDAFVNCSNSLLNKVKKLNKDLDALKREIQLGYYGEILGLVLGTTTTHLEMEIAIIHARPMKTPRDVTIFQLQWPSAHREWTKQSADTIEHMLYAVGLGILMLNNTALLEELYSKEEIEFFHNNKTLYDFENDFEYMKKEN